MKKTIYIVLFVPFLYFFVIGASGQAPNTWIQMSDVGINLPNGPTGRHSAVGFSIGTKGYIGTGQDGSSLRNDFWEFDQATNVWTQKASFAGPARSGAAGFSIGTKGYVGTGMAGASKNDFWEYDPAANTWTQKASFGGSARNAAVGFSIGSKGYIGTGYDGANKNDFWEYDPAANSWTQKAPFGGTGRYGAVGFSIGSKGYIGTGYDGANKNDFWEYDPTANAWTQKAAFAGTARYGAVGFNAGAKGYVGSGTDITSNRGDFWEYDPAANSWTLEAGFAGAARNNAVGFGIGLKGYVGTGADIGDYKGDLWELDPTANTWTRKTNFAGLPRYLAVGFAIGTKGYIGTGGDAGGKRNDFWEFDPVANTWTQKANFGGTARYGAVGFSIGSKGYIGTGFDGSVKNDFWEYDPASNTWTQKAPFGGTARIDAVGFGIGTRGYIGTGYDVGNKNDFWEYDPATNTWTQKAAFGGSARYAATGFSIGTKGFIGTGTDGSNKSDFWEYDPASNSWTQKASFVGAARSYASGFSIGTKGYLGTGSNGSKKGDFWEYDPAANVWTQKADFGGTARDQTVGFGIGTRGYIGTGLDAINFRCDFWEYSTSCSLPPAPVNSTPPASLNICAGSNTLLTATGSGILGWYSAPAGGTWLGGGGAFTTPVINVTTTYYVQDSTCGASALRTAVMVTVSPAPIVFNVTGGGAYCTGGTGVTVGLSGSATGINYALYNGASPATTLPGTGSALTFGLLTTAGTYSVVATNASTMCTSNMNGSATVTVNPMPVVYAMTGGGTCCAGGTGIPVGLSGSAVGINYALYNGAVLAAIVPGTGSPLNFGLQTVAGNYTVVATNPATTCTSNMNGSATVIVSALPVPTVTGPTAVCQNSAGNVYTTLAGMAGYSWTVSSGGTITAGGTSLSNSVTVTWNGQGSQSVGVSCVNPSGCASAVPGFLAVTVSPASLPTISGNTAPCTNSGYTTYSTEPGMNLYNWNVSSGGAIFAGQGSNTLQVEWIIPWAQTVSVSYVNPGGCGSASPAILSISVNAVPGVPVTINGPSMVCAGQQGVPYSVPAVPGATAYLWFLPVNATISSGSGSNSILVNFAANAQSGPVTVVANNICGDGNPSPPLNVTVNSVPAAAGAISGPASVCSGSQGIAYSTGVISGATGYIWTVPSGAVITSGANTNAIGVNFGATTGTLTVSGINSCGTGTVSSGFTVTVNPIPAAPAITVNGYVLTSSAPTGNQWYRDATAVSGATGQTYTVPATAPGWYWSVVTLEGCASDTSNHQYILGVGTGERMPPDVSIYPVPSNGHFSISISNHVATSYKLEIYNTIGVKIIHDMTIQVQRNTVTPVDISHVLPGLYTIKLTAPGQRFVYKILVSGE